MESLAEPSAGDGEGELRMEYSSKLEYMLSLVGFAVGLGNIWRFPYLMFENGGGAFLIPYALSLAVLGLPLFTLELGLGQMFRQGTLGVWEKLGLPRMRALGACATCCTFLVCLYYNVIVGWTLYYIARTLMAMFSGNPLPWSDKTPGFECPQSVLFPSNAIANNSDLVQGGLFNQAYRSSFWCPKAGIPTITSDLGEVASNYTIKFVEPLRCPAAAALQFWERDVLQQSSGFDDIGGIHWGQLMAFTLAWILVYLCVYKGIESIEKIVHVITILPFVALGIFFVRAITLPNAMAGVSYVVTADFSLLLDFRIWLRAAVQIFYSLGIGFGSLVAFASYSSKTDDFPMNALTVALINCGTSLFASFVEFPLLGYLAFEMSNVNPCISANDLNDLTSIGLQGTGLAFVAFPIAISQMAGGFFWALLFFVMLLCLGIDTQFAMVMSVMTVVRDAGYGKDLSQPVFSAIVCGSMYILGLVFITRGGVYWFSLFDYYSAVIALFVVCFGECVAVMWLDGNAWTTFHGRVKDWTGREMGPVLQLAWKWVGPVLISVLIIMAFQAWDLMGARTSKPYPEGNGFYPEWSIWVGWALGFLPIMVALGFFVTTKPQLDMPNTEVEM